MKRLLLIGDTSLPEALGSKLLRGAKTIQAEKTWDISVMYHSPAANYSPSMCKLYGKIFYKFADKRSLEWWSFQEKLVKHIKAKKPDLTIVTGVLPLEKNIFNTLRNEGSLIVNYLTDDPWNRIHRRQLFIENLSSYNHVFSTKKGLLERLKRIGTPSTSWLPFAYDPVLHHEVESKLGADVAFIGTGARERLRWIKALEGLNHIDCHIYGNSWTGLRTPGWVKKPAVTGYQYCEAIHSSKIVLGLVRAANGDQSTDRSYEIGAIGGCGLYQDTKEHRELLPTYPELGFFQTPSQLRDRVEKILENPELQMEMRRIGTSAIRNTKNTYADRLRQILSWAS